MTNAMDPRCLFGKPDPLVAICRSLLKKLSKSWGVACLNKWFQSQFLVRKGNWWYTWLECSGCTWLYTMWGAEHLDNLQPDFRYKWPNIRQPFGIQVTIEVRKWFKVTLASESNKTSVWHCLKLRYTYLQTISLVGTIMINQYINVCLPLCSNTPSWKKLRWLDSQYSNHLKHSRYSRTPFLGRTIIHVINPYKSLVEKLAKAVVNALCTDQNCTCTSYWPKWYSTTPNVNLSCFDVNRRLPSGNLT